jgi:hypothetical protein
MRTSKGDQEQRARSLNVRQGGGETKHTPGPWKWRYVPSSETGTGHLAMLLETVVEPARLNDPCVLAVREDWQGWLMTTNEGRANARLIAAAPQLLEALAGLVDAPDDHHKWRAIAAARAAIEAAMPAESINAATREGHGS